MPWHKVVENPRSTICCRIESTVFGKYGEKGIFYFQGNVMADIMIFCRNHQNEVCRCPPCRCPGCRCSCQPRWWQFQMRHCSACCCRGNMKSRLCKDILSWDRGSGFKTWRSWGLIYFQNLILLMLLPRFIDSIALISKISAQFRSLLMFVVIILFYYQIVVNKR